MRWYKVRDIITWAKEVFDCEIIALKKTCDNIDANFELIIDTLYNCKGKVIVTGVGKTGHIGQKFSATLSSLGTSSVFMNAAEALHGDLGIVERDDTVIFISKSGESDEIKKIIPNIKIIGAKIIAITHNVDSLLAQNSDIVYVFPSFAEACHLSLAPTSSTTVAITLGDAIAVVLAKLKGFTPDNFGLFHPGGSIGKRLLLKVSNVAACQSLSAIVPVTATFAELISIMCKYPSSISVLIDSNECVVGVVSDGDIRRQVNNKNDVYALLAKDIMTTNPLCIREDDLAINALKLMQKKRIHAAPVVSNDNKCVGVIGVNDIIEAGILT